MQLVEEATEGCWIGHQARMFTSEIGSVYSPPKHQDRAAIGANATKWVETVIDVDHEETVDALVLAVGTQRTEYLVRVGSSCARRVGSGACS